LSIFVGDTILLHTFDRGWNCQAAELQGLQGIIERRLDVMNDAASQLHGEFKKLPLSCM
jgi:hypothetical protein